MGLCAKDPCPVKGASSPFDVITQWSDEEKSNLFRLLQNADERILRKENDVITRFALSPDKSESFVSDLLTDCGIQQNKDGSICSRRLLAFFPEARHCGPNGVAIGRDGSIIVADCQNHRIRKIEADGRVSTLAGSGIKGFKDGEAHDAQFNKPYAVAIGMDGYVVVADEDNHRIRRIETDGLVSTLAGCEKKGFKDGEAHKAQFNRPIDVAICRDGSIIVADCHNHRIRKIETDGRVTTLAGSGKKGFKDAAADEAQFNAPYAVAIDRNGDIIVADHNNHNFRMLVDDDEVWVTTLFIDELFIDAENCVSFTLPTYSWKWLPMGSDQSILADQCNLAYGVAIDSDGCILIADDYGIRRLDQDRLCGVTSIYNQKTKNAEKTSKLEKVISELEQIRKNVNTMEQNDYVTGAKIIGEVSKQLVQLHTYECGKSLMVEAYKKVDEIQQILKNIRPSFTIFENL